MKTVAFTIITSVLVAFSSCSEAEQGDLRQIDEAKIIQVSALEFKDLLQRKDGIILDVRTPEEIENGYVEGASFIDFYDPEFKQKIQFMDKSKPIYTYCRSGGRSSKAAEILIHSGFDKVYNLDGGIGAWARAEYALVSNSAMTDRNIQVLTLKEFSEVLASPLPVLIDFHTQWCAPCKKMAPIVDKLQKKFEGKAEILRIDVDKSKEIGTAYSIRGVPVFVLFNAGKEIWRHTGLMDEVELRAIISNAINTK